MIEFTYYVEIPIRVYAEYQPEERATGCPSAMGIYDIEVCIEEPKQHPKPITSIDELRDWIFKNNEDSITMEAWEMIG